MPTTPPSKPPQPDVQNERADGGSDEPAPVTIPIEDVIDLHAFAARDVRSVVEEYLSECRRRRLSPVRLIHGKGRGVQRRSIHALLARLPFVTAFHTAPPEAGGWGATIVSLDTSLANPQRSR